METTTKNKIAPPKAGKVQKIGTKQAATRYLKGRTLDITGTTTVRDLLWSFAIIRNNGKSTNASLAFEMENLKSETVQKAATVKPAHYYAVACDSDEQTLREAEAIKLRLKEAATNEARKAVKGETVERWTVGATVESL